MGACIGAVLGLVGITPAAGFVSIGSSILIGFIASIVSNLALTVKSKTAVDDTLDVFPCHGVGGIVGMLLTSVFAKNVGIIYGETKTFFYHLLALVIVMIFCSLVPTLFILLATTPERCAFLMKKRQWASICLSMVRKSKSGVKITPLWAFEVVQFK